MTLSAQSWIIPGKEIESSSRLDAKFFHPNKLSVLKNLKTYGKFSNLKELCIDGFPARGDAPYKPKYVSYGVPVLVTDSLTSKGIDWKEVSYVPEEVYKKSRKKIKVDDILIASTGMGSIAKVDIVSFIPKEYKNKCIATPKLTIVRVNEEKINAYYLWIYLLSYFGQIQILTSTRGQTGQLELYPQDIESILVPLAPTSIQNEIASKAKKAMKLKAEILNLRRKLSNYHQLIFRKAKPQLQFLVIKGSELEDRLDVKFYLGKKIVESYSNFNAVPLRSLIKEPIRCGSTPSRYAYRNKGAPIIKVRHLTNEGIEWDEISFVENEFYNQKKKAHVKNNDVLVVSSAHSLEGIAEKADVVKLPPQINKCLAVAELLIIRVDIKRINPYYLAWILRSDLGKLQIKNFTRGESGHIYGKDIEHALIPYPSKALQDEIGEKCKKIVELRMKSSYLLKEAQIKMNNYLKTISTHFKN